MTKDVIMREIHLKKGQEEWSSDGRQGSSRHRDTLVPASLLFYVVITKAAADMASQYRIERDRGTDEFRQQLAVLREKWPLAFPAKPQDVRPLASGAASEIGAAMGWSHPYTIGVLSGWKLARTYCEAVLSHDQRIALDGAPAEPVDAEAKELAAKQLAKLAARKAAKSGKSAKKVAAPASADVKPAPGPPAPARAPTPEELRTRVRASLLRRSA
jgi:sRNA-binding protein